MIGCLAILPATLRSATIVYDNFSDGMLDSNKWEVLLPETTSSVVESHGFLTTTSRGILATKAGFGEPMAIMGQFMFNDYLEHFNIVLRTDLRAGDYNERSGILVSFSNDGDQISIQRYNNGVDMEFLSLSSYALASGLWYNFMIIDDGANISLFVNGVRELTADCDYSTGNKVAFYSRHFSWNSTTIDYLAIASVPDLPTTIGLLSTSLLLLGVSRRVVRISRHLCK